MKNRTVLGMLAWACMLSLNADAAAKGIAATNAALSGPNPSEKYVYVKFDIAWSNSWRTAVNWDAAWVFVKYQAPGSNNWQHATLSTKSGEHLPSRGSTVSVPSDGKGAFIYRSPNGTGNVNYREMKLRWNYGTDGYSFAKGEQVKVSVHAIEMVHIPRGKFYLGSTGTEIAHFYKYTDGSQSTTAYLVSSESAITVGKAEGNLCYESGGIAGSYGDGLGPVPGAFPKGYNAFYCMKYEITQGQYADFLNKLTKKQCKNRYPNANGRDRHTISGSYANYTATAPDRACNYISWSDGCAYAAWAALRPMTELEYEKACRGPALPVAFEYAWGSTVIKRLTAEKGTPGSGTETSATPGANCVCGGRIGGPARVGIFETGSSNRQSAGAGYYGAMELSGNVNERCVTVGRPQGRDFKGTCGSGVLSPAGDATNADWYVSGEYGGGYRGGYWRLGGTALPRDPSKPPVRTDIDWGALTVSARNFAANVGPVGDVRHANYSVRNEKYGWRGVRQLPEASGQ